MARKLISHLATCCLFIILVPAGALKVFEGAEFARQVEQLSVYPVWTKFLITHYLPWVELGVGGLALHQQWRPSCGALAGGLALGFAVHMGVVAIGNLSSCACMLPVGHSSILHWTVLIVLLVSSLALLAERASADEGSGS